MLEGGIRLSGAKIRGGYTLWQEDLSELTEILDELEELRRELMDANTLSMQNYQMDRRIRALAEKNRLHDELHRQTAHQIGLTFLICSSAPICFGFISGISTVTFSSILARALSSSLVPLAIIWPLSMNRRALSVQKSWS